jgi:thiol-disulfide isomerase/thioredoxin
MATKKSRRGKSRRVTVRNKTLRYKTTVAGKRTTRKRRSSTAGKILPPLNVQSNKHLKEFERRIKSGDLTIILVWAQWCPHCHTMMPHFDAAAKSPNRSIQAVKVEETMVPAVNQVLAKNINRNAKPLNVEGYPSIIVVDKQGNQVTNIEPVRNTATMTDVMAKAGPLAKEAGINTPSVNTNKVANNIKKIANGSESNNMANLKALTGNMQKNGNNTKNTLMTNIGVEEEGLVTGTNAVASPKNFDVGEDELKGSIVNNKSTNKNTNYSISNDKKVVEEPVIKITPPPESIKKMEEEAEEITSLAAPLTPPSIANDIESTSISNSLNAEQKVSGGSYGGGRGGSLYSTLARTTYTLAPAAALLATSAMVMKKKHHKTHKKSKKSRKTHHRRR